MNNGDFQNPQGAPMNDGAAMNEATPAAKPKKSKKKIAVTIISIILVVALLAVGVSALYVNFIAMPNPMNALGKTLEKKFAIDDTKFDFGSLDKGAKVSIELEAKEDNMAGIDPGKANLSTTITEDGAKIDLGVYDEKLSAYLTPEELAVLSENFNNGEAYGVSLVDFREALEDSIFGPDSGTDYELPEEIFDMICQMVEIVQDVTDDKPDKEAKQNKKDAEAVLKLVANAYKDSELSKVEKDYGSKDILGEKRSARSKTYTINADTVQSFVECLAEEMDGADKKTVEAAERILEKFNASLEDVLGAEIEWDDLVELVEEAADADFEDLLGDLEIKIQVCYVKTYVSAFIFTVESDDMELNAEVVIDFGKNPVKTVDTIIAAEVERHDETMFSGRIEFTEEGKGDDKTFTLHGEMELYEEETVAGDIVFKIDGDELIIDVSYTVDDETNEILTVVLGYEDTKDTWAISFKEITFDGETIAADDIGFTLRIAITNDFEDVKVPSYTDILEMNESEMDELLEELETYFEEVADQFDSMFSKSNDEVAVEGGTIIYDEYGNPIGSENVIQ